MIQIFTWEMLGNHQTSIKNWLFRVPGIYYQRFQVPKDSGIPNLKVLYVPYVGLF